MVRPFFVFLLQVYSIIVVQGAGASQGIKNLPQPVDEATAIRFSSHRESVTTIPKHKSVCLFIFPDFSDNVSIALTGKLLLVEAVCASAILSLL